MEKIYQKKDHYIYQLITTTESIYGIQDVLQKEFKQIYSMTKDAWSYMTPKKCDDALKHCNAIFLAKDRQTEKVLGFLIARLYQNRKYDDSYVEKWITNSHVWHCGHMRLINAHEFNINMLLQDDKHPIASLLRMIVVDKRYRHKGVGLSLFNSLLKACNNEYIVWQSDYYSNYNFYLQDDRAYLMQVYDDGTMLFFTSKDKKKRELLAKYSYLMPFPESEYKTIRKQLNKNKVAYTVRVSSEKDRYIVGNEYFGSFGAIIKIKDKKEFKSIYDYPSYNKLPTSQINEILRNEKNGVAVYSFSIVVDNNQFIKH